MVKQYCVDKGQSNLCLTQALDLGDEFGWWEFPSSIVSQVLFAHAPVRGHRLAGVRDVVVVWTSSKLLNSLPVPTSFLHFETVQFPSPARMCHGAGERSADCWEPLLPRCYLLHSFQFRWKRDGSTDSSVWRGALFHPDEQQMWSLKRPKPI